MARIRIELLDAVTAYVMNYGAIPMRNVYFDGFIHDSSSHSIQAASLSESLVIQLRMLPFVITATAHPDTEPRG